MSKFPTLEMIHISLRLPTAVIVLIICAVCMTSTNAAEQAAGADAPSVTKSTDSTELTTSTTTAPAADSAAARADELVKEMHAQQLGLDDVNKADLALIDLLIRKAEAYALVEQPVDAGRMLNAAQQKIASYHNDQRLLIQQQLKAYSDRLFAVAQSVLEQSQQFKLEPDTDDHNDASDLHEPAKSTQAIEPSDLNELPNTNSISDANSATATEQSEAAATTEPAPDTAINSADNIDVNTVKK